MTITASHAQGRPMPPCVSGNHEDVVVAPIAAHNAPHLLRYQRSRILIQRAQEVAQLAIATRAEEWLKSQQPQMAA